MSRPRLPALAGRSGVDCPLLPPYTDDFILEPTDDNKFHTLTESLGYIFSPEKSVRGSVITALGIVLNMIDKTATIDADKKYKIEKQCTVMLYRAKTSGKDLQKLLGRIGFASKVMPKGRLNSYHLDRALAVAQAGTDEVNSTEDIVVTPKMAKELNFWLKLDDTVPFSFVGRTRYLGVETFWSDACSSRWAVKIGSKTISDRFDPSWDDKPIILKEAYAVLELVNAINVKDCDLTFFCDNMPLCQAFAKKFSKNEALNELLIRIFDLLLSCNNSAKLIWTDTNTMASHGADPASRGNYAKDKLYLSEAGVRKARLMMGDLTRRLYWWVGPVRWLGFMLVTGATRCGSLIGLILSFP